MGNTLAQQTSWIYHLSQAEINELDAAIGLLVSLNKPISEIRKEEFPLKILATGIAKWSDELNSGLGFVLVRGFPSEKYSVKENSLAYWLIGRHLGEPISQNSDGEVVVSIRDTGANPNEANTRLYKTRAEQDFHTDGADIIGLLCLQKSKSGGASRIVSSVSVYNEIVRQRPDLSPLMFEDFYWHLHGQHLPNQPPYFKLPICAIKNGHFRMFYLGWYIRKAQELEGVPKLSAEQNEVLELLESIANNPKFYLDMSFEKGDMQFLKNSVILHKRTSYEDFTEPEQKRHLLRLWLVERNFVDGDETLRQGIQKKEVAE
ncbi:MAG TPA: TauD/TfdA family dioxygenase [Pyrinomonadaceae bacterium]|nr:TauD/TfdA family dioxygenase [Pyrinomonadaceae bacterium]